MAKLTLRDIGNKLKEKLQTGVSNVGNFAKQSAQYLPPVQAYNAVKTMATPQWQQNPIIQQFSKPSIVQPAKIASQMLQKVPEFKPFGQYTSTLAPGASFIPQMAQSYGKTLERLTTPKQAVQQYKAKPFTTAFEDIGNLADFAPAGVLMAGIAKSNVDAKALKPFLPEIRNVKKMLGNMDELPNLSQQQINAAESIVAKIRGSNAVAQLNKLNKNPKDFYNSLRVLLSGAEDQILNPQMNIGFTTKAVNTPRAAQAGLYDTKQELKKLGITHKNLYKFKIGRTIVDIEAPSLEVARKKAETQFYSDIKSKRIYPGYASDEIKLLKEPINVNELLDQKIKTQKEILDRVIEKSKTQDFYKKLIESNQRRLDELLNIKSKSVTQQPLSDITKGVESGLGTSTKRRAFSLPTLTNKVGPGFVSEVESFGRKADLPLLDTYKGYDIVKAGDDISVWDKNKKTLFRVGLDDSKQSGERFIDERVNTIKNAKNYIDWLTESKATKGVESMPSVMKTPELPKVGGETLPLKQTLQSKPLLLQTPQKPSIEIKQSGQALEDIIAQGRKQIGGKIDEPKVSFKQSMDNLYTQWVDRFNPIVQASQKAKGTLKKGASLRPEYDPEYLVRRLTGAGGIADNQFKTQLEPIIKQVEDAGISKLDLDTYLANKRIAGFGKVNRDIYGADPVKAGQIVSALETKYPNIGQFADQLYSYQNKGFQEMVDAGFISPENAKIIQGQNPDYAPLKRVMDEVSDYLGLPTRKTMQGSQPITKIKGSTRQIESPIESIIGNTFSQRAAIEKNRVAKAIVGLQEIAGDMGFTKVPKSDVDTITVWNNGQKEYWNVGKDIADVAKGVNEEQMNLVLKVLQAPAALLRQGATGRNPEFMIPNIVRDQLDAGITSKYGYIPFVDYVSGLKSMITNDDIYQKWANSGAKIDLGEMSGKKSINAYFDTATKKKGLFNWLGAGLDVMGKYSEVPTRVGLFKKAYKKTGNDLIAAIESRDATVDFARMGSKMKVANSIIPFLNVGVQGFDKLIRSVKNNPAKVLFNATLYGTAPAIATTVYNLANHPKEYAEIPQYEKDSNFVLVRGRNQNGTVDYLTFPKGNVLPTITNPVQSFIDYLYGNNQQSFKEMALQTISSTLPVIGDGQSFNEIALKTVGSNIPQLFKPAAENILNKSFYKYDPKKEQTKDIVPFYLQDEPAYKQTYKFTPQMYQKIGALINASPLKVQNIMEGYLAGYAKIPAQIIETATKASKGEEISPNEKTILRRFIKQTYPSSGTKKVETKPAVPSVMERLGMAPKAAEVPENLITYTKDGKNYEVDLNKSFEYPTMDTSTALGKEAISRYKSEISSQVNKIYDAYKDGKITEKEASDYINQLSIQYDKTKKPKKPKKITLKVSSYKAPKITIKKRSSAKLPTIKFKKPKKTKMVRRYTIK